MQIYAHRGSSGYAPENTLEAFRLAAEQRADGIELDVQMTRDRQLIVIHDERIDRVSDGSGYVFSLTLKEIKSFCFSAAHPEYAQAKAPTLEEVLQFLRPTGLGVNIELKNSRVPYEGMEERCLELVHRAGMQDRTIYSSFNHHSMMRIKKIQPEAVCGLLYDCCLHRPLEYLQKTGADALHPHYTDVLLNPAGYALAKERGAKLHVWTVNDDRDMRRMNELDTDILITNYPDRARALAG